MRQSALALILVMISFIVIASGDRVPPPLAIPSNLDPHSVLPTAREEHPEIRLDLMIHGDAYFRLEDADGSFTYTRDGRFHADEIGRVVDEGGNSLSPPISIPFNAINVSVGELGLVSVMTTACPTQSCLVGALGLFAFPRPERLEQVRPGVYKETPEAGEPVLVNMSEKGSSFLISRAVELNEDWIRNAIDNMADVANSRMEGLLDTLPIPPAPPLPPEAPPLSSENLPVLAAPRVISELKTEPESNFDRIEMPREMPVSGTGVVFGLKNHGSRSEATRRFVANMFKSLETTTQGPRLDVDKVLPPGSYSLVMVTALVPPTAKKKDCVDVVVSTMDDATSLDGGTLVLTALLGPDGETYAIAQGKVVLRKDERGGVKESTNADIPAGAIIERAPSR